MSRGPDEPKPLDELDKLISVGKQKGYVTYDEVSDALPAEVGSLEQLEEVLGLFGALDIEVVDAATRAVVARLDSGGAPASNLVVLPGGIVVGASGPVLRAWVVAAITATD